MVFLGKKVICLFDLLRAMIDREGGRMDRGRGLLGMMAGIVDVRQERADALEGLGVGADEMDGSDAFLGVAYWVPTFFSFVFSLALSVPGLVAGEERVKDRWPLLQVTTVHFVSSPPFERRESNVSSQSLQNAHCACGGKLEVLGAPIPSLPPSLLREQFPHQAYIVRHNGRVVVSTDITWYKPPKKLRVVAGSTRTLLVATVRLNRIAHVGLQRSHTIWQGMGIRLPLLRRGQKQGPRRGRESSVWCGCLAGMERTLFSLQAKGPTTTLVLGDQPSW